MYVQITNTMFPLFGFRVQINMFACYMLTIDVSGKNHNYVLNVILKKHYDVIKFSRMKR